MKLAYVLSKDFIELVRANMDLSKAAIIRMAERRYIWSNPKANEITIMECDVERAMDIVKNEESHFDRYASVYTWMKANAAKVKSLGNDVKALWTEYRAYITAKGIEWLWAATGVYNSNCAVEKEFKEMATEFASAE